MFKISKILHPLKFRRYSINRSSRLRIADRVTIGVMVIALIALGALVWYQVRPIKTLEVEVPVLIDKAEYGRGEFIKGTFFGEVTFTGPVTTSRRLVCGNTQIPMENSNDLDSFFDAVSIPRKLNGETITIGQVPATAPVGARCLIQMINVYDLNTPFGNRHLEKPYYTLSFIIKAEPAQPQVPKEVPVPDPFLQGERTPPLTQQSPVQQTKPVPAIQQVEPPTIPPVTTEQCAVKLLGICVRL